MWNRDGGDLDCHEAVTQYDGRVEDEREQQARRMSTDWVQVWNCAWLHEAQFLTSVLESAGIESMLPDQYTLGAQPFYAPALGGVRILVPSGDLERARELLESAATPPDEGGEAG